MKNIFSYINKSDSHIKPAPFLPMTRKEMDALGWESCDIIIVTGDAYVDHPGFGMAIIGRLLEAQGFKVGIIAQPDWKSKTDFMKLGRPGIMFGVTSGNMDSMVNHYTSDQRIRSNDAYTPADLPGKRPDRAVMVYAQRCREAYTDVPLVIGGIEASLRRAAHYDYWSDKVRRSVLLDSKADMLIYGNGERQITELAHLLKSGKPIKQITNIRGTAFIPKFHPIEAGGSGVPEPFISEGNNDFAYACTDNEHNHTIINLPSYEQTVNDPIQFARAAVIMHSESVHSVSCAIVQQHGERRIWINPPSLPLTTEELDSVYELPYTRKPHPAYGRDQIPAFEMIKNSITIARGCFGGCSFCSITSHEGKRVQNRSESSILNEIENVRDKTPGFTGIISDLGGPTANMYRMNCKTQEKRCRKPSCLYPSVCVNLNTDHSPLISLYRNAGKVNGINKVLIGSGVRYDLAIKSPEYVKELVTHHVGGYLKIAPEHTQKGPLKTMMKPDITSYLKFESMFFKFSKEAAKKQYLIPYFIAAHPGTTTEDMVELALWLKQHNYKLDQVQTFLPSPMTMATAIYYSGKNVFNEILENSEDIFVPKGLKIRRLHKAFIRYHDPANHKLLGDALKEMGRNDLIGNSINHLVPHNQSSRNRGNNKMKVPKVR